MMKIKKTTKITKITRITRITKITKIIKLSKISKIVKYNENETVKTFSNSSNCHVVIPKKMEPSPVGFNLQLTDISFSICRLHQPSVTAISYTCQQISSVTLIVPPPTPSCSLLLPFLLSLPPPSSSSSLSLLLLPPAPYSSLIIFQFLYLLVSKFPVRHSRIFVPATLMITCPGENDHLGNR